VLELYWNFPKSCLNINKASGVWGRMKLGCEPPRQLGICNGARSGTAWAGAGRGAQGNFPFGTGERVGDLTLLSASFRR